MASIDMFVGKHRIKTNNLNHLSNAFHHYYGVVVFDGSTVLLVACSTDGLVPEKPSKLGVFSDNVESVAWSNATSMNVYLSVQLRSQVNIFKVSSDSESKPVFTQVLTFDLQSKSAGCVWHTRKPVICILHKDHVVILNVATKETQKLRCNGGQVKTGVWTPDGTKLIIAINSTLKVFSWDDSSASEVYEFGRQDEIGGIRNIVALSNELVAIATDLPLERLIMTSGYDMFAVPEIKGDELSTIGEESLPLTDKRMRRYHESKHESSENRCDDGHTKADSKIPFDVGCSEVLQANSHQEKTIASLLRDKLDLKSKGSIDLTELLSKAAKQGSMQTLSGVQCVGTSDESGKVNQNARISSETSGEYESCRISDDERRQNILDLTNIRTVGTECKGHSSTDLLHFTRKLKENVKDSSYLIIFDLKHENSVSKVRVPCIINPDLLLYMPGCHCIVVGSNSQPRLPVFNWKHELTQKDDLELPPDEKPVGLAVMPSDDVLVMSAKSDQLHRDTAFLHTYQFASVDIHLRKLTIKKESLLDVKSFRKDVELPCSDLCLHVPLHAENISSDIQCLHLPAQDIRKLEAGNTKKIIEEMNVKEEINAKELISIQEIPPQKDVGVQCESNNYPLAESAPSIELQWFSGKTWVYKSFVLESKCYLRLCDVKNAYRISEVEIKIGGRWFYLPEDKDGFAKMRFKPGCIYQIQDCHYFIPNK
ncbi:uncharacterized protein LOC117110110 [Anneissia japonica]|uniref:uncharacterized protein LOC117110110 n=1 Tax=Anneissia japonica TaxID=1529436 RepID=UPI0014255782|nr:uncharacterized protein LOC117110110 [Anneissia japonica]